MSPPFPLPDWLPWWVPLAVLLPVLLYVLLFLAMPFSVFGIKGRLEQLEAQLDEIQDELRRLGARPPEPPNESGTYAGRDTPPAFGRGPQPTPGRPGKPAPGRVEPRLGWSPD